MVSEAGSTLQPAQQAHRGFLSNPPYPSISTRTSYAGHVGHVGHAGKLERAVGQQPISNNESNEQGMEQRGCGLELLPEERALLQGGWARWKQLPLLLHRQIDPGRMGGALCGAGDLLPAQGHTQAALNNQYLGRRPLFK